MTLFRLVPRSAVAGILIIVTACVAYWDSLSGPFIFDDEAAILRNPSIRSLEPPWRPLLPPCDGSAVDRRPITNLSLALNYAVGGTAVRGYHLANVAAHAAAALILCWLVQRTLRLPAFHDRFEQTALGLALVTSLVWVAHPLQTNAVTYVIQRTEVLAGLFSFVALACTIHAAARPRFHGWHMAAVAACGLALGSKESAAALPVFILAYDAMLLAGSWKGAVVQRGWFHGLLAATWIVPAIYLWRDRLIGVAQPEVSFIRRGLQVDYLLSQFQAVCLYVKLALWPAPLILDYGPPPPPAAVSVALAAVPVLLAIAATALAVVRHRPIGLLGLLFFGALAPSSLIPIVPEWAAEKRMYVALVAVVLGAVLAVHAAGRRLRADRSGLALGTAAPLLGRACSAIAIIGLVAVTARRNEDYRTELSIWEDNVSKCPGNPRGQSNLGLYLEAAGRPEEAAEHYRLALEYEPDSPIPLMNLAGIRSRSGDTKAACELYGRVVELLPDHARARRSYALALMADGRIDEAIGHLRRVAQARPDFVAARVDLAKALSRVDQGDEAVREMKAVVRLAPEDGELAASLGLMLARQGRTAEAIPVLEKAVRLRPDHAETRVNLGLALTAHNQMDQAIAQYREALRLRPDFPLAIVNLADALAATHRPQEAIELYRRALPSMPHDQALHRTLAWLLATRTPVAGDDPAEAVQAAERACRLEPRDAPETLDALAAAYASAGQFAKATAAAERAIERLRKRPDAADHMHAIEARLSLYRDGKPYREPAMSPTQSPR